MDNKIKIYTSEHCIYCNKLKVGLDSLGLTYTDIDVDYELNSDEVQKVYDLAGIAVIPIIIIKPNILVPEKSFNTIDEAIELIKTLIK